MHLTLKLLPTDHSQREARAWLVPGSTSAEWLAELTAWEIDLAQVRLLRLPVGLFVITTPDALPRASPHTSPLTLSYGALADNLFVPVEAALECGRVARGVAGAFSSR